MVNGRGTVNRAVQVLTSASNGRIQLRRCPPGRLHSVDCSWQEQSLSLRSANLSHQPEADIAVANGRIHVLGPQAVARCHGCWHCKDQLHRHNGGSPSRSDVRATSLTTSRRSTTPGSATARPTTLRRSGAIEPIPIGSRLYSTFDAIQPTRQLGESPHALQR